MEFADYYVVPVALRGKAKRHYESDRIWTLKDTKWLLVFSSDQKLPSKIDVAMHFHDDEGAAWGFTLWVKKKRVATGLFGENAETGVALDDNVLKGDLSLMAKTLGVDAKKLAAILKPELPDSGKFAKLIGFGFVPFSSFEADSSIRKKKTKTKARAKKKSAKKTR